MSPPFWRPLARACNKRTKGNLPHVAASRFIAATERWHTKYCTEKPEPHATFVLCTLHAYNRGPMEETLAVKPDAGTHRLLSSSFLGLPYRILNMNHKKELLRSLWVFDVLQIHSSRTVLRSVCARRLRENATRHGCPTMQFMVGERLFKPVGGSMCKVEVFLGHPHFLPKANPEVLKPPNLNTTTHNSTRHHR